MLKQALVQLFLLVFACGAALAAPQLDLGAAQFSLDGSTVTFPLILTNTTGVSLASLGTTLQFDQTRLGYAGIVAGAAATSAVKDASANSPDGSSVIIAVAGFNANLIANGTVALVTFTVKFAGGGAFVTNSPSGSDAGGSEVALTGSNGVVLVNTVLEVDMLGTGSGSVNSVPGGINSVGGTSQAFYYLGAPVILTALTDSKSEVSWTEACSGCTGQTCQVTVTGAGPCGVVFTLGSSARIGTAGFDTLQAAYDSASDGATVQAREQDFPGGLSCNLAKKVVIKGGYDQTYSALPGFSSVKGVTISKGTVVMDRVLVY